MTLSWFLWISVLLFAVDAATHIGRAADADRSKGGSEATNAVISALFAAWACYLALTV